MNYGRVYALAAAAPDAAPAPPPPCGRACFLGKLRHRTIYFIGDSHMRVTFYGLLARLGVAFPPNKIWRGDRSDRIASHNATVKFVASYFLNVSKPTAQEMLRERGRPIVVAGVGQHHSCHCWTLRKHMAVVGASLAALQAADIELKWFGVPAQPVNRHLHMPKPVGQARRDCRNNARHLLYNAAEAAAMAAAGVPFIDTYGLGAGMAHTSLDGAHFYTWVREAWLDAIAASL
jgi:hypothetical protein